MNNSGSAPTELGTKNIGTLLRMYAVPGIIAMTASSLYNMVDSIYIGHLRDVGAYAISGLAVTFPLMNLSTAFGTLVGAGASTLVSVMLGQKNYGAASKVLANVVSLNTIIGVLFAAIALIYIDPILHFFGASDQTLPFAKSYMQIILFGNVITHLYFGLNNLIRASGNPKTAMGLTLFTVTLNAILDPVCIFVLDLGIRGAAIATVICQATALIYTFRFFLDKKRVMHFPKGVFQLDWKVAKSSLSIGMGPFLMNSASCIVTLFINQQLGRYGGDMAIGAYGIVNRINFMFIMIVMGFCQGLQPIAGYNFGARQYSRVRKVFWMTAAWATLVTTFGGIISEFVSGGVVGIFTNDPELRQMSAHAIRVMNIAFPLVGFQMVIGNFFQCLGMVKKSIFLSLSRQLLFLVPMVYLLPLIWQESGVWASFPLSDSLSIILATVLILSLLSKLRKLKDGDDPSILGGSIQQ